MQQSRRDGRRTYLPSHYDNNLASPPGGVGHFWPKFGQVRSCFTELTKLGTTST